MGSTSATVAAGESEKRADTDHALHATDPPEVPVDAPEDEAETDGGAASATEEKAVVEQSSQGADHVDDGVEALGAVPGTPGAAEGDVAEVEEPDSASDHSRTDSQAVPLASAEEAEEKAVVEPVSYTHLTLPTICSV